MDFRLIENISAFADSNTDAEVIGEEGEITSHQLHIEKTVWSDISKTIRR